MDNDYSYENSSLDEPNQDEVIPTEEQGIRFPVEILVIVLIMLASMPSAEVQAQGTYDTPDSVLSCPVYVNGTQENLEDSGYAPTETLQPRNFTEVAPGVYEWNRTYMSTGIYWDGYDFAPDDYYRDIGKIFWRSSPLIDWFLAKAFDQIDRVSYQGADPDQIFVTVAPDDMYPVFMALALSFPEDVSEQALQETIDFIRSNPQYGEYTLDSSIFDRANDLERALSDFRNYELPRDYQANGVDYLSLEEIEHKEAVDEANWDTFASDSSLPDEVIDFIRENGYTLKLVPMTELDENVAGEVYGTNILIGYREDGTIDTEIGPHELLHVISKLVREDLKPYISYNLADGSETDDFQYAVAVNLKYFFENDTDSYPLFNELVSRILHASFIENEDLRNFIIKARVGYTGLQLGYPDRILDVDATFNETTDYNGLQVRVIEETAAMIHQYLLTLCLTEDEDSIPSYILELFDYDYIVEAINAYRAAQQEP
jgi:hypothetical protein